MECINLLLPAMQSDKHQFAPVNLWQSTQYCQGFVLKMSVTWLRTLDI